MLRTIIYGLSILATNLTLLGTAFAETAERFYPVSLQQDGRVTLTPGFTPDGNTIYFAQSECSPIWKCPQTLKRSHRTDTGWTPPIDVSLGQVGRVDWPRVSPDGNTLLFSWSADRKDLVGLDINENFDLFTLDLTNPGAPPAPIYGGDINRPRAGSISKTRFIHNETLPSLTNNGTLYFMTERPDGTGERDIYITRKIDDGRWAMAVPLPAPINTSGRDDGVWVDATESTMLLTYPDRGGQGGSDLFVSFRQDGTWTAPVNLGSSINTRYAEFGAVLTPDKQQILFSSDRPFDDQPTGLLQVWVAPINLDDYR